ncbi:hypothetical protein VU06_03295, partial [Desulfobulbus sp. F3]|nr:hypothetical protein [Desulfobulbus sp. F3]
ISPNSLQIVLYSSKTSFNLTPAVGYSIGSVTGCGGTLSGSTYTTGPVTADCSVTASFTLNSYTVTPSAGANGSISPNSPQTVNHGATKVFTVTADTGYTASVTGCGGTLSGSTYTTGAITGNCAVTASFTLNSYTVTPSAGSGGTISPDTAQTVDHGATTPFTVTPDEGYSIASVTGCNGSLNGNTYTTGAITADCAVTAFFRETDSDGDGIDDAWEEYWFGDLTTASASSDYDKDGYSDLQEYLNALAGQNDPAGAPCNPKEKNAPGGTGYRNPMAWLPAVKLLLKR